MPTIAVTRKRKELREASTAKEVTSEILYKVALIFLSLRDKLLKCGSALRSHWEEGACLHGLGLFSLALES